MINLKELAKHLVEKHELTAADAEHFVTQFIETLQESVLSEKLVKVKGLGAFKLTPISARESVDVNTGDRIVIEGRDKITFTPDNAMKDLVNRPFSQFDTVVLNAGVAFDEAMETDDTEVEDAIPSAEEKTEHPIANAEPTVALAEVEKMSEPAHPITTETKDSKTETSASMAEAVKSEPRPASSPTVPPETAAPTTGATDGEPSIAKEPQTAIANQAAVAVPTNERVPEIGMELDTFPQSTQRWVKWTIGICTCLLIALMGTCFYLMGELHLRNNRIDNLMALMQQKQAKKEVKRSIAPTASSAVNKQFAKNDSLIKQAQQQQQASKTDMQEKQPPTAAVKQPSIPNEYEAINQSDARIRTGAYNIVGIKTMVKVEAGQTLHAISRAHLGSGMECYIEALNRDKLPLKAGDKIKIPLLKLKKHKRTTHSSSH
ncbi:HU family DNA-binding protein [Segatella oulorum]|uniref:HU family DNA-binding protein n=1 Tax=Segatella oulorum TaxID=28136 RepID=UPI0028E2B1E7|nr:HU family DNA-binding protein [Segatella oulorum]